MALTALKERFSGKAAAAGIAAALVVTPVAHAMAQDAPQQQAEFTQAAATTNIALTDNASQAAHLWAQRNQGIAVAVMLGTESRVTPEQIEQILTREIQSAGVRDVEFFYEQNDVPGTVVGYSYNGGGQGPFNLARARDGAADAVRQYLYQRNLALNF